MPGDPITIAAIVGTQALRQAVQRATSGSILAGGLV